MAPGIFDWIIHVAFIVAAAGDGCKRLDRSEFYATFIFIASMQEAESPENLPPPPVPTSDDHPYAIFRNRDFTFYLLGRLVAVLGQQMFVMAVGWELYERTGSALALGLVGLTQMVPMFLFTLPAGHVADNYNRKRVVMWMTTVLAVASLGVAVDFGAPRAGLLDLSLPVRWRHRPHVHVGGQRRLFAGVWWIARCFRAR